MNSSSTVRRKIIGFHQDDEGHWVATLECGHRQHMRHNPPFVLRPWVMSAEGREAHIGVAIDCPECGVSSGDAGQDHDPNTSS